MEVRPQRQQRHEGRERGEPGAGLPEYDLEAVVLRCANSQAFDRQLARGDRARVLQRVQQRGVGCGVRRAQHLAPGMDEVVRGDGCAVLPGRAAAQPEGRAVGAQLPALGQCRREAIAGVVLQQPVHQVREHEETHLVRRAHRVQARRLGAQQQPHRARCCIDGLPGRRARGSAQQAGEQHHDTEKTLHRRSIRSAGAQQTVRILWVRIDPDICPAEAGPTMSA